MRPPTRAMLKIMELDDDTLLFAHSHIIRFRLSLWYKCQFDERPLTGNAVHAKRYWFI